MKVLRISHSAVVGAWRERERALRRAGMEVELLSAARWNEAGKMVELEPEPDEHVAGVRTLGSHPALFVYDPRPIWRALATDWDLLDIHEEPFALATAEVLAIRALRAMIRRVRPAPYVMYSAQNIEKRYPWPFRVLEKRALQGAGGMSVCSAEAARIVRVKGLRGPAAVIGLGVDTEQFHELPEGRPRRADPTAQSIRVGYSGRLSSHKGVDVLLEAVKHDDRLALDVAGDGPDAKKLRRQAAPFSDRVHWLGFLTQESLPQFYRNLDVLAVPSLITHGWIEQFGRVAVEAMACGVPVVATDSGALPDVVAGAGLLVRPGDSEALRDALVRIGTEPDLAAELKTAGVLRTQNYTWPEIAHQYVNLYRAATAATYRPPGYDITSPTAPPLEVVLVAYGAPELVRHALAPLVGSYPITVVDNSSLSEIRSITEQASGRYLDPGSNGGFAAGVNFALTRRVDSSADVLLLNPDAVIQPADVESLRRALHAGPRTASVGPTQVDGAGTAAKVGWPFPTPYGTWIEAAGLGRWRRAEDFVIGSVLLLNGAAIAEVGPFDQRFFLYAEETDWAYRASRRGWNHQVVSAARAIHIGGGTSKDPVRRETHFFASQERYYRKHFGNVGWLATRAGAIFGASVRAVLGSGSTRQSARRRLYLYVHGPVILESKMAGAHWPDQ